MKRWPRSGMVCGSFFILAKQRPKKRVSRRSNIRRYSQSKGFPAATGLLSANWPKAFSFDITVPSDWRIVWYRRASHTGSLTRRTDAAFTWKLPPGVNLCWKHCPRRTRNNFAVLARNSRCCSRICGDHAKVPSKPAAELIETLQPTHPSDHHATAQRALSHRSKLPCAKGH